MASNNLFSLCTDPEHLGVLPSDMPKWFQFENADDWSKIPEDRAQKAKEIFMVKLMEQKLNGVFGADKVTAKLVDHCVQTTRSVPVSFHTHKTLSLNPF